MSCFTVPTSTKDGTTIVERQLSDPASEFSRPSEEDGCESTLKAAYRKVDLRLIAWYSVVHFFLKIEGSNITNTAIMNAGTSSNIQRQLGNLTSEQWALVLSVSHYPLLVFEPFSAFLLKKFSPRKWMSRIIISWGIVTMCNAATHNFGGIIACRVLSGVAEAGLFPGILYHLSFWYPTRRLPWRIAFFAASGAVAGAISGLLAFAVSFLDGKAGLSGWRWLFIIEGTPPVICGVLTFILLPDYPENAAFLTAEQRRSILEALPSTQPNAKDKTCSWVQIKAVLKDPTTWLFFLIPACHAVGSKAVVTVLPTVLLGLGITGSTTTQLLTMPLYIAAALAYIFNAWLVRTKNRNCWCIAIWSEVVCCACYIILLAVQNHMVKYVFIVIGTTASAGVVPILWPERIRIAHGTSSAALGIGLTATAPILNGIIGPQIYQKSLGPTYRVSYSASVALLTTVVICIAVTWAIIRRRDKKAAQQAEESEGEMIQIET